MNDFYQKKSLDLNDEKRITKIELEMNSIIVFFENKLLNLLNSNYKNLESIILLDGMLLLEEGRITSTWEKIAYFLEARNFLAETCKKDSSSEERISKASFNPAISSSRRFLRSS